ncbi:MAG: hypothetical protein FWE95_07850 [Planctomycetaceae bacterium]|nr:hypothetical protein [Planctomycetaceae bacterium]
MLTPTSVRPFAFILCCLFLSASLHAQTIADSKSLPRASLDERFPAEEMAKTEEAAKKPREVLTDTKFAKGFVLTGATHAAPTRVETFGQKGVTPEWRMPQWQHQSGVSVRCSPAYPDICRQPLRVVRSRPSGLPYTPFRDTDAPDWTRSDKSKSKVPIRRETGQCSYPFHERRIQ